MHQTDQNCDGSKHQHLLLPRFPWRNCKLKYNAKDEPHSICNVIMFMKQVRGEICTSKNDANLSDNPCKF